MATLLPGFRSAIAVRNQALRMPPLPIGVDAGLGGRVERASRAYTLPDG